MTVKELYITLDKLIANGEANAPVTVHIGNYDERDAVIGIELVKNTYSGKGKILILNTHNKLKWHQEERINEE